MTIQFHWEESDYVAAQVVWIRHHPWPLLRGFWYPILILVIAIAIVVANPEAWISGIIFAFFALLTVGLGILVTRWRWHRRFKRTPLFHDNVAATIGQDGISLHGQSFENRNFWGEFSDIYEANSVFVFGRANNTFLFILKREMTPSQIREMRNAILSFARVKPRLADEMA